MPQNRAGEKRVFGPSSIRNPFRVGIRTRTPTQGKPQKTRLTLGFATRPRWGRKPEDGPSPRPFARKGGAHPPSHVWGTVSVTGAGDLSESQPRVPSEPHELYTKSMCPSSLRDSVTLGYSKVPSGLRPGRSHEGLDFNTCLKKGVHAPSLTRFPPSLPRDSNRSRLGRPELDFAAAHGSVHVPLCRPLIACPRSSCSPRSRPLRLKEARISATFSLGRAILAF